MIELLRVAGPEGVGWMALWTGIVMMSVCGMVCGLIGKWIDRDKPVINCQCGCCVDDEEDE